MSNEQEHRDGDGLALKEAKPELREPSMYKVFLLNDDYTPMEFVVTLLEKLFGMDREKVAAGMAVKHENGAAFRVEDPAVEQPRCDASPVNPLLPRQRQKETTNRPQH